MKGNIPDYGFVTVKSWSNFIIDIDIKVYKENCIFNDKVVNLYKQYYCTVS